MSDVRVGYGLRRLRHERKWRQKDLATAARVSATLVSRIEHGDLEHVSIGSARRTCEALGARVEVRLLWRGGELERLLDRRHAAMADVVVARIRAAGWVVAPEVTFSIYGERGSVDVLAWHAGTATLLVVELKTELTDLQDLLATVDRKRRLAPVIARDRGLLPVARVATWVIVLDTRTNRRRLAAYRALLRASFPADGRAMRAWLETPSSVVNCLGFLSNAHHAGLLGRSTASVRANRPTRSTDRGGSAGTWTASQGKVASSGDLAGRRRAPR